MKAPEKIYIADEEGCRFEKSDSEIAWNYKPPFDAVEYTRTDAFIEKACEYWYQYNLDIVKKHGAKAVLGCGEFTVNVGDFKKYMEG